MTKNEKELSNVLKERFCKDCNISMQLFDEPYFKDRLKLFGKLEEYNEFAQLVIDKYGNNEEEFLAEYNSVKNSIIDYIKNSSAHIVLNLYDMSQVSVPNVLGERSVFKIPNIGREFISIDMVKANFSALVYFSNYVRETKKFLESMSDEDKNEFLEPRNCKHTAAKHNMKIIDENEFTEFFESYDYALFMRQFTDVEHFIKSKYIRQVVFGNCNPKRQVTYERFLTFNLFKELLEVVGTNVYSFNNDEIIIDSGNLSDDRIKRIYNIVDKCSREGVPFKCERYTIGKIDNTDGFVRKIQLENGSYEYDLKCLGPIESVFAYRLLNCEEIKDADLVFLYDKKYKVKMLEKPEVKINFTPETYQDITRGEL